VALLDYEQSLPPLAQGSAKTTRAIAKIACRVEIDAFDDSASFNVKTFKQQPRSENYIKKIFHHNRLPTMLFWTIFIARQNG